MIRLGMYCAVALALTAGFVGCSDQGPKVNYIEGVVTLDGKPIEGATVSFSPVDSTKGAPAVGNTNANGVFTLTTVRGGKAEGGAATGDYYVTFQKSNVPVLSAEESQKLQNSPEYGKSSSSAPPKTPVFKNLIPTAYGDSKTSGFKVTVKPGKNVGDEFKFDLKSSPGAAKK